MPPTGCYIFERYFLKISPRKTPGREGGGVALLSPRLKNIYLRTFLSILHEILYLYWQYGIYLDKKNWQMSLLWSFDDVIMKVMCWQFLSLFRNWCISSVNWVCKLCRKQVAGNNSKKLIIILQYKNIFQKINHFDYCIKILEFPIS